MEDNKQNRVVITDANILINLIHVKRLSLLRDLPGFHFVVGDEVLAEINKPAQALALKEIVDRGDIGRVSLENTTELALYAEHSQFVGKGEASCLAIAEVRGWLIASDERRKFQRIAEERIGTGRILNTPGIYVMAIRSELLSVEDADADKQILERHRFKMRFKSFRDICR